VSVKCVWQRIVLAELEVNVADTDGEPSIDLSDDFPAFEEFNTDFRFGLGNRHQHVFIFSLSSPSGRTSPVAVTMAFLAENFFRSGNVVGKNISGGEMREEEPGEQTKM
jgi:hypothetical protein